MAKKMDERVCFVYDLDWKCYKNTKSKKKRKGLFGEALFLTTSHLVVLLIL